MEAANRRRPWWINILVKLVFLPSLWISYCVFYTMEEDKVREKYELVIWILLGLLCKTRIYFKGSIFQSHTFTFSTCKGATMLKRHQSISDMQEMLNAIWLFQYCCLILKNLDIPMKTKNRYWIISINIWLEDLMSSSFST